MIRQIAVQGHATTIRFFRFVSWPLLRHHHHRGRRQDARLPEERCGGQCNRLDVLCSVFWDDPKL